MPAMGKFPRPPCFSECYVCGREFSSRSLDIHEPQCLVKWHRNNNRLPISLRKTAPVNNREKCVPATSNYCAQHSMDEEDDDEVALLTPVIHSKEGPKISSGRPNLNKRPLTYTPTASPAEEDVPFFEISRPSTATLEHPRILDESYVDKLDMSLTRKELLDIANLCKISSVKPNALTVKRSAEVGQNSIVKPKETVTRRLTFSGRNDWLSKKNRLNCCRDRVNLYSAEGGKVREARNSNHLLKTYKKLKIPASVPHSPQKIKPKHLTSHEPSLLEQPKILSDHKVSKKVVDKNKQKGAIGPKCKESGKCDVGATKTPKENVIGARKSGAPAITMPCSACSRHERPERFHSHPPPAKAIERSSVDAEGKNRQASRPLTKNTVQKPIPLRFQSAGHQVTPVFHSNRSGPAAENRNRRNGPIKEAPVTLEPVKSKSPQHLKQTIPTKSLENEKKAFVVVDGRPSHPLMGKTSSRAILCYLCGKEFGASSFPLHHPRCIEKWNRANSLQPQELRRVLPLALSASITPVEWNDSAWRLSQAHLVECENCSRTFLPERLQVHLRSCRPQTGGTKPRPILPLQQKPRDDDQNLPQQSPLPRRPIVPCYICGREFGSKSIGIHEPQCLAKWRSENERLPPHQRRPEPRKQGEASPQQQLQPEPEMQTPSPREAGRVPSPGQSGRPPTVPCYLCGRQFGTKSIAIHEPQCLKKWRAENEKLPPERRRPEPQKPEIRFKENGEVDCEATFDAIWETHLQQLVPCKLCGRTFFPDRIHIHERSCKGNGKK